MGAVGREISCYHDQRFFFFHVAAIKTRGFPSSFSRYKNLETKCKGFFNDSTVAMVTCSFTISSAFRYTVIVVLHGNITSLVGDAVINPSK